MDQVTKKPLPPLILGIVTASRLKSRRYPDSLWNCGGAELRADGIPPAEIPAAIGHFLAERRRRNFSGTVVLTLRLKRDGGAWIDSDSAAREKIWRDIAAALSRPDFVDIEIEVARELEGTTWQALKQGKVGVLLSHHAFSPENPGLWEEKLSEMRTLHPDAVKFAVWPPDRNAAEALLRFARRVAMEFPLSCVLGMGEKGRPTRLAGPLMGCPIAYAFLDEGPVAPGQIPVGILRNLLSRPGDVPGAGMPESAWLDWAEEKLGAIHAAS